MRRTLIGLFVCCAALTAALITPAPASAQPALIMVPWEIQEYTKVKGNIGMYQAQVRNSLDQTTTFQAVLWTDEDTTIYDEVGWAKIHLVSSRGERRTILLSNADEVQAYRRWRRSNRPHGDDLVTRIEGCPLLSTKSLIGQIEIPRVLDLLAQAIMSGCASGLLGANGEQLVFDGVSAKWVEDILACGRYPEAEECRRMLRRHINASDRGVLEFHQDYENPWVFTYAPWNAREGASRQGDLIANPLRLRWWKPENQR